MIRAYLPAIVFVVLGVGLGVVFTTLNSVLGPKPKFRRKATSAFVVAVLAARAQLWL